jgi:hypothetical protein
MNLPDDIIKNIIDFLSFDENVKNNFLNKDFYNHIINSNTLITEKLKYDKKYHYEHRKRIKKLYIDNNLDHTLSNFTNLQDIEFSNDFYKSIGNFLPSSLLVITLGKIYNFSIDQFPDNINTIILSEHFSKSINKLPEKLEKIVFGNNFNRPFIFPQSNLISISFGDCFNNQIVLPTNLEELKFGLDFNREINVYPNTLKILHFGARFNQPIHNLPENLEELKLYILYNKPIPPLSKNFKTLIIFGYCSDSIKIEIILYKFRNLLVSLSVDKFMLRLEDDKGKIVKNVIFDVHNNFF